MESIVTSIIGALGVILAATIPVYILNKNSKKKSKENSDYLLGKWKCEWWEGSIKSEEDDMPEIHFNEILGDKISGKGWDKNGQYVMDGKISNITLTLNCSRSDNSGGELILTVEKSKNKMDGTWKWWDSPRGRPYGGKTVWTKSD